MLRVVGVVIAALLALGAARASAGEPRLHLGVLTAAYAAVSGAMLLLRILPPPEGLPRRATRAGAVLASVLPALAAIAFFREVIGRGWLADDYRFAVEFAGASAAEIRQWWLPSRDAGVQIFRPLSHTTSLAMLATFGPDARAAHLLNLLLHAGSAALLARIVLRTTGQPALGLVAGLAFATGPLAVPTVAWIATHQDPFAVFFTTAALAAAVEACDGVRWMRALSVASIVLGLLSKESAIAAPVLVVAATLLFDRRARSLRALLARAGPAALAGVLYVAFRLLVFGGPGGYIAEGRSTASHLRSGTVRGALLELPEVLLVPANTAIVPGVPALRAGASALAVLLLAAALAEGHAANGLRVAALGVCAIAAGCAPVHNMIWMGPHLLNARYLYLASAGSVLVLVGLLGSLAGPGGRGPAGAAPALGSVLLMGGFLSIAVANREQWLANESIHGGIARDLRGLDAGAGREPGSGRGARVGSVSFHGFPDVWAGSYIFALELLPRFALGKEPSGEGLAVRYRFEGGERLWTREVSSGHATAR